MDLIDPYNAVTHYTSTSDDHSINTPASFSDSLSQDFQDPGPFEMEQPPVFTRVPFEPPKTGNANCHDVPSEKPSGQPELLASRLQNLHLSNAEKLAQSQTTSKTNSDRQKNGSMHPGSGKDVAQTKNSVSSGDKASGLNQNHEPRQQTSNSKRGRPNGVDASEKANGVNHGNGNGHGHSNGHAHHGHSHKPKAKGRQDASTTSSNPSGDPKDRSHDNAPRKQGGAVNGTNDVNHSGWQTTGKKKHRRNARSSAAESRNGVNGSAEPLPADESLRKGG
jgi:hypothetical protein